MMLNGLSLSMKVVATFEALIAALFLMWGSGESYRNSVGRGPSVEDVLFTAIPLVLVIAGIAAAAASARAGRVMRAWIALLLPLPTALFLFGFLGAI